MGVSLALPGASLGGASALFCELLRSDMSCKATAALVHIGEGTLHGWLRRGKAEKSTKLSEFLERVREARANGAPSASGR